MLDVAIGMTFVFLLLSLVCTAINELLEAAIKFRAKDLEKGLGELIAHPEAVAETLKAAKDTKTQAATTGADTTYLEKFYQHPLVNSLFLGKYVPQSRKLPSYIPARTFALAIMDVVLTAQATTPIVKSGATGTATNEQALGNPDVNQAGPNLNPPAPATPNLLDNFREAVGKLPDNLNLKRALLTLTDAAGNDIAAVRANIENWYNGAMDRVSGGYKRRAQTIAFCLGCLSATCLNADAVAIFKSLTNDADLRNSVVAAAANYKASATTSDTVTATQSAAALDASLTQLEALKLPLGWDWPSAQTLAAEAVTKAHTADTTAATWAKSKAAAQIARDTARAQAARAATPKPSAQATDTIRAKAAADTGASTPKPKPAAPAALATAVLAPGSVKAKALTTKLTSQADSATAAQAKVEATQAAAKAKAAAMAKVSNRELAIPSTFGGWMLKVLGLLITGIAVSLGAPFWFDVLNKFMVVRSTVKPHEKSLEEDSEDRQNKKKK